MKQFFKDLFASDNSSNQQRHNVQPIYSYQIPSQETVSVRRTIQKGPADAGPSYNIAGS